MKKFQLFRRMIATATFALLDSILARGGEGLVMRPASLPYVTQLTAERLLEKRYHRGAPEQVWIIGRQEDHLGDCEMMQLVQRYMMGGDIKKRTSSPATASTQPTQAPRIFLPGMPRQAGWITGWKG